MLTFEIIAMLLLGVIAVGVGAAGALWLRTLLGRAAPAELKPQIQSITEKVRTVGKIVGLEVSAKEIATATKGWAWLPPLFLSQARLAMIFQFEKQYFVDLRRLSAGDVRELGPGRWRITLPAVEGSLRLTDVTPYDIQDGRMLGLLDVIPMNADTQKALMQQAQQQAAELYKTNDERYLAEARLSIERHLRAMLELLNIDADVHWADRSADERPAPATPRQPPQRLRLVALDESALSATA